MSFSSQELSTGNNLLTSILRPGEQPCDWLQNRLVSILVWLLNKLVKFYDWSKIDQPERCHNNCFYSNYFGLHYYLFLMTVEWTLINLGLTVEQIGYNHSIKVKWVLYALHCTPGPAQPLCQFSNSFSYLTAAFSFSEIAIFHCSQVY